MERTEGRRGVEGGGGVKEGEEWRSEGRGRSEGGEGVKEGEE